MTVSDTTPLDRTLDNGVAVDDLRAAREALTGAPAAARFAWRASSAWVSGTHTRTVIDGFSGLGRQHSRPRSFAVDTDYPEVLSARDDGPTPVEMVLAGLAGCLTAGVATVAAHRGVTLRTVTATVEGDHDVRGILGIDPAVRNGFTAVRVRYEIDADASREDIEAIVVQAQKRSAVFDVITNPTNVRVDVA